MMEYILLFILLILLFYVASQKMEKSSKPIYIHDHENANVIESVIEKEKVGNSLLPSGLLSPKKADETPASSYHIEDKPNYHVEDETQYAKKELLQLLMKINKKPIRLTSPCVYTFYNHATTDDLLRRTLDEISSHVVTIFNEKSHYNFQKANYGDIHVWCDAQGNKEYKYELFLWSLKHYFQLKFYVHVVKFVKKSDMKPYCIESSPYIFPTYHNGYPCKDQMIPAPHEVIPTANVVLATESVKPNNVEKTEYMYLNQIDVENSTLVINANIQKDKQFIMDVGSDGGVIDNKLEYSHLKPGQKSNPIQPVAREANRWVETPDKPSYMGQYPCKVPPEMWDEDGIYYYSEKREGQEKEAKRNYEVCVGTRSSTEPLPLQPNFWVNNYAEAGTGINCGPNSWLFSNYNGAMGTFFGGGKR